MLATEHQESSPKYLVVDDEIVRRREREAFIKPTRLPLEAGIFVETYEEALETLKSNPDIIFCFIDIRIPRNKQDKYEQNNQDFEDWQDYAKQLVNLKNEYGAKLLPQLKTKTVIFSAYAELDSLRQEAEKYPYVVDSLKKPFKFKDVEKLEPYLKGFRREISSVSILAKSFDYSSLDDETFSFVHSRVVEIRKLFKRAAKDIIDIGTYLVEVKDKLGHGNFYNWLETEFNWSSRTANRFMSVAQKFQAKKDRLSALDILPSALYVLASPSTPEEAVDETIERASQGETIAEKTAKEIKAKYKALKEQPESTVQPQNTKQAESIQAEKKDKPKQSILAVVPSSNAVSRSWWQLGEHHRLFCGEPKDEEFLNRIPENIALKINFLPKEDFSLVPSIKSISSLTFYSEYEDLNLDWVAGLIEDYIDTSTQAKEIIVFNYIYDVQLLELTEKLRCYFYVAEPDLEKCEQILTIWREKGTVMRIKN